MKCLSVMYIVDGGSSLLATVMVRVSDVAGLRWIGPGEVA